MTINNKQQGASFSNNGKVSLRQMSRMMFLEVFGFATLVLPGPLAKLCQTDGVFAILVATAVWTVFFKCRKWRPRMSESTSSSSEESVVIIGLKTWRDTMKAIGQVILFSLAGGFLMYLLVSLVERQLLDSSYLWIIVLTILVAGGYGIIKGVESRARIYEILFWILLVPLILILIIGVWNVNPDYWLPIFSCGWKNFALGIAASLATLLPSALCILLCSACTEPEGVAHMAARTVWKAGLACAGVYLLLVGVFQSKLLSVLKYPILSLMAVVEMPGNLLERLDAPMMIIWFFCLFALFHSLCYYGVEGIQRLFPKRQNRGRKVVIGMVLILSSALLLLLHGCGKKDPENNLYPLAIGIEYEKDSQNLKVAYGYPLAAGNQGSGKSSDYKMITAESLLQAETKLETGADQMVDLNHMKVFVISREFLQDEEQKNQLFSYFLENENMAWNTCIIFTETKMEELFANDSANGKALGMYLEDLLKSREDIKDKSHFTVKDYMSLCKNENETMLVPLITMRNDQISIDHYCILSRGTDRGILTTTESAYARVLMDQQKTLPFLLDRDEFVTIQDLRMERKIYADEEGIPQQELVIRGNLQLSADWIYTSERKEEILSQTRERLEWELTELIVTGKKEKHVDLTNSFLALSGQDRTLWELYQDNPDAYEKKLETTVEVKLKMLET